MLIQKHVILDKITATIQIISKLTWTESQKSPVLISWSLNSSLYAERFSDSGHRACERSPDQWTWPSAEIEHCASSALTSLISRRPCADQCQRGCWNQSPQMLQRKTVCIIQLSVWKTRLKPSHTCNEYGLILSGFRTLEYMHISA